MFTEIFGDYPKIKVIDYLLSNPFGKYTKQQIAVGSEISRITLNKFIDDIVDKEILIKEANSKYSLNLRSPIVQYLNRNLDELNKIEIKNQMQYMDEPYDELNHEELDKIFDEEAPNVDLDELERKIAIDNVNISYVEKDEIGKKLDNLQISFTSM